MKSSKPEFVVQVLAGRQIMATKGKRKIVFESVKYASQQLDIKQPTIHHYLNTGKVHPSGYSFKYVDTKR
ncbi:MAG: hypothetical protein ABF649_07405 [Bacillus sp. (in: firmicutes)]